MSKKIIYQLLKQIKNKNDVDLHFNALVPLVNTYELLVEILPQLDEQKQHALLWSNHRLILNLDDKQTLSKIENICVDKRLPITVISSAIQGSLDLVMANRKFNFISRLGEINVPDDHLFGFCIMQSLGWRGIVDLVINTSIEDLKTFFNFVDANELSKNLGYYDLEEYLHLIIDPEKKKYFQALYNEKCPSLFSTCIQYMSLWLTPPTNENKNITIENKPH